MKKDPFILQARSPIRGPTIMAHNLSNGQCRRIRAIVTNNWMDSEDYKLARGTGAFLQGYQESYNDDGSGWVLVEFWSDDINTIQTYIDHINKELMLGIAHACHMCGKKSDLMRVMVDDLVSHICTRCNRKLSKGIQKAIHSIGTKRSWKNKGYMRSSQ